MLVYTIFFGLLSIGFVRDNFENRYHVAYVVWTAVFYGLILTGNLIYSLDCINPTIRKIWKLVFPVIILQFVSSDIVDILYGSHAHKTSLALACIVGMIDFALFFPTFLAHYKIGYGKEIVDVDI